MSSRKKPTFQEIRRQREQRSFVGRQDEQTRFRDNLGYGPEDLRRKFVFNVFGQGGIGKTTLLRTYERIACDEEVATAWTDDQEDNLPAAMNRIALGLEGSGQAFKSFREAYERYLSNRHILESDPDYTEGFAALLGSTITHVGMFAAKASPAGPLLENVDVGATARRGGEIGSFLAKKLKKKEDVQLMREPIEGLTPRLLEGIQAVAEEQPVALFFDTYERTSSYLDAWLRDLLHGRYGELPGDFLLVIAGRNELDGNHWSAFGEVLVPLELNPFTEVEARDFLKAKGVDQDDVVSLILEFSGLLPLLLATLAASRPTDPNAVGDVAETAVGRFLSWVDESERRELALAAALPRKINRNVVDALRHHHLRTEEDGALLFEWLLGMPFVKKRRSHWAYHEEVRAQMLRHLRQRSPQEWRQIHEALAEYFRRLGETLGLPEEGQRTDVTWQDYRLERVYHQLCAASTQQLSDGICGCLEIQRMPTFAHRWARTLQDAGRDAEAKNLELWGGKLLRWVTVLEEDDQESVVKLAGEMLDYGELSTGQRCSLLNSRAAAYRSTGKFDLSLADYSTSSKLVPGDASVLADRGLTRLYLAHFKESVSDLDRSIELKPGVALAYGYRGLAYRFLGRFEDALSDMSRSLELRSDVAWVLANRGFIYRRLRRFEEALSDLNRSLELEQNVAWVLANRGVIHLYLGRFEDSLSDLSHSLEVEPGVAWVLANRGFTYRFLGQFEEALSDLSRSLESEPDEAWVLEERARVYLLGGQLEKAALDIPAPILNLAIYYLTAADLGSAEKLFAEFLGATFEVYDLREGLHVLESFQAFFPEGEEAVRRFRALLVDAIDEREKASSLNPPPRPAAPTK